MASRKQTAEAAVSGASAPSGTKPRTTGLPEKKFKLSALREHSKKSLGVEDSVMAGAFSGVDADATFTLSEAQARIDKFMATPVPRRNKRR